MTDDSKNSRRSFMKVVSVGVGGVVGVSLGFPFLESVVAPSLSVGKGHFAKVARIADLPTGAPVDRTFADSSTDAFIQETLLRDVWVVKHSPSKVDVFSPICPHLGCRYNWHADRNLFICPCHGSRFALSGKVEGGPAPRPLDTLPTRIEHGELSVEWERFKVGIAQKARV